MKIVNTWKICLKLTLKTPERCQWLVFIWTDFTHCTGVSVVDFEQVNDGWVWIIWDRSFNEKCSRHINKSTDFPEKSIEWILQKLLNGYIYKLGYNLCRLFHVLAQLLFTTSETELYYYHQKVNIRVAWWVVERFKILGSLEIRNFQENHWNARNLSQVPNRQPKR